MKYTEQPVPEGFKRISIVLALVAAVVVLLLMVGVLMEEGFYTFPPKSFVKDTTRLLPFVTRSDVTAFVDENRKTRNLTDEQRVAEVSESLAKLNATRKQDAIRTMWVFWIVFVGGPPLTWAIVRLVSHIAFKAVLWTVAGFRKPSEGGRSNDTV